MTKFKFNARFLGGIIILLAIFIIMIPILIIANEGGISSEDVPTSLVRPFSFEVKSGLGFLVVAGGLGLFLYLFMFKKKNFKL